MHKFIHVFFLLSIGNFSYSQLPNNGGVLQQNRNNSQQVIQQQNRQIMQNMGYKPPPTQVDIQRDLEQKRANAQKQQLSKQEQSRRMVYELLKEDSKRNTASTTSKVYTGKYRFADHSSTNYKENIDYYQKAYNELNSMLKGEKKLDLKRAIYLVENAINKDIISYDEYLNQIKQVKKYVEQIMKKEKVDTSDYLSKHYAIQKLYSDTAENTIDYDFEDIYGIQSGFVTKLLGTGTGQCRSMPLLYLILSNEFNIESYLAFSPRHSYIRYKNRNGYLMNFETTNGCQTTDDWVRKSGNIRVEAIKSKSYMAPLKTKEVIAHLLGDLANTYKYQMGYDDFMEQMLNTSLKHFPHLHAKMEMANLKTAQFDMLIWQKGYPPIEELKKNPSDYQKWEELLEWYDHVVEIGYVQISEEEYEEWLKSVEEEKNKQDAKALQNQLELNLLKK